MPTRAHVTSVEALEVFRAALIIYLSKARPTLEEVSAEVTRTRLWLENDQRLLWEGQLRRRTKVLEQAQQALFGAKMSNLREPSVEEQMAVRKARNAVEEAEAKLKRIKMWSREFDRHVDPLVRQLEKLNTVLTHDMANAVAHLAHTVKTLADYAGTAPPAATTASAPAPAGEPTAAEAGAPATSVESHPKETP